MCHGAASFQKGQERWGAVRLWGCLEERKRAEYLGQVLPRRGKAALGKNQSS